MSERIAVVLAHPDDAEIWVGGTLINHRNSGDGILICYLYYGEATRQREALASAQKLGAQVEFVQASENFEHLTRVLAGFAPSIVITHWEMDTHFEHVKVSNGVNQILPMLIIECKLKFNLFACDCYNSASRSFGVLFSPSDFVDITGSWKEKLELIAMHRSQPVTYWQEMIERQSRIHGARVGVTFAEGFLQIPILGVMGRSVNLLRGGK